MAASLRLSDIHPHNDNIVKSKLYFQNRKCHTIPIARNLVNLFISKSSFAFICGVIFVDNPGFANQNQLFRTGETDELT